MTNDSPVKTFQSPKPQKITSVRKLKTVDKWIKFWHFYLKDIAHSHSTQLLIMCSESQKNFSTALKLKCCFKVGKLVFYEQ